VEAMAAMDKYTDSLAWAPRLIGGSPLVGASHWLLLSSLAAQGYVSVDGGAVNPSTAWCCAKRDMNASYVVILTSNLTHSDAFQAFVLECTGLILVSQVYSAAPC
jgi:hypothetical protein